MKKLRLYFKKALPYYPNQRQYKKALNWLKQARAKIKNNPKAREYYQGFGLKNKQIRLLSEKELHKLLDIITYSEFDKNYHKSQIENFFFQGSFNPDDSIYKPEIKNAIRFSLKLMKKSQDPAHGFSHIIRTARLSKIIYSWEKEKNPNLDWGIIATACAWHDVYRVKHLGFLYSKNTNWRKFLRTIALLQDIIIYSINTKDSFGSCFKFLRYSKKKIPNDLKLKIASAILGERRLEKLEKKIYPDTKLYKNIIICADTLDLITIGRWEEMHRNTIFKNKADKHLLNRLIILNMLFNIPNIRKKLKIKKAKQIYKIISSTILKHTQKFYPDDAKFMIKAI